MILPTSGRNHVAQHNLLPAMNTVVLFKAIGIGIQTKPNPSMVDLALEIQ